MKHGLDMISEGYTLLNVPELKDNINGGIYLIKRPQNSQKEDVVLNSLAITGNQLQNGVFNVNTHAPNLKTKIDGKDDNTMPDTATLSRISAIVVEILEDVVGKTYRIWIDQPGTVIRDDDGTYYINTRVNYSSFQPNFKNI